jgi:uncharacterized membrane protein
MNFCSNCGTALQPGAAFCSKCGAATASQPPQAQQAPMNARQGLAQAGLEIQAFNGLLILGRLVGLAVGMAILWFVVGPALGEENPLAVIAAFLVLAFGGLLAGQWITLQLMRR